jgi:hypothetical protein
VDSVTVTLLNSRSRIVKTNCDTRGLNKVQSGEGEIDYLRVVVVVPTRMVAFGPKFVPLADRANYMTVLPSTLIS